MNGLEQFLAVMEYQPVDRVPNWELGVWPQTRERWEAEGLDPTTMHWNWSPGEGALDMDPKEFIHVRYVCIDTDGNPEPLLPLMLDAGIDVVWPLERSADQDPVGLRKTYGRSLRLWGGVDKRVLTRGPEAIDEHLRALAPLIQEGGYIPTIDHTVPPDASWPNFEHYMESKIKLLRGEL